MRKKSILISTVLTLLILATILAGCSGTNSVPGNGDAKGSTKGQDVSSESVSLRVIAITHAWTKDLDEIPMFNKLNEEIGVNITWEQVRSGWDEKKTQYLLVEMFRMRLWMGYK